MAVTESGKRRIVNATVSAWASGGLGYCGKERARRILHSFYIEVERALDKYQGGMTIKAVLEWIKAEL